MNNLQITKRYVREVFTNANKYMIRQASILPQVEKLHLGESRKLHAVIMFIDMRGSTHLSQHISLNEQIQILHTYLTIATEITKSSGAYIEKYTGDGIMAIFAESKGLDRKTITDIAFQTAKKIITTIRDIVNPVLIENNLPGIQCAIGMDYGEILISRIGIRGENDLVAIGSPANLAAKIENETPEWKIGFGRRIYDTYEQGFFAEFDWFLSSKSIENYSYRIMKVD